MFVQWNQKYARVVQSLAAMVMLVLSLTLLASLAVAQEDQPNPQNDGGPVSVEPAIVDAVGSPQADPLEPNNTRGTATVISYNTTWSGLLIDPVGDYDYFRFSGQANDTIIVDIDAQSYGSSLDSYVQLQSSTGTVLAFNDDDGVNHDSYLTYHLPAAGSYYIRVSDLFYYSGGGPTYFYTIKLTKQTGGTPVGFYVSGQKGGTFGGLSFTGGDILAYSVSNGWSMHFDASDVNLPGNLSSFSVRDDNAILMSFAANVNVPGVGAITPQDVVIFFPSSLGNTTSGEFAWYIDGSDVNLTTSGEKLDALFLNQIGKVVASTMGAATLNGTNLKSQDEDIVRFTPTGLGQATSGSWDLVLDGSTITGMGAEDINAVWRNNVTGDFYIAIVGAFNLGGVAGNGRDIVKLTDNDNGTFTPALYWDGSAQGFPVNIDGLEMMP